MPRWLRIVVWLVAIAAVIVLLFTVVFPRVERILQDPTMDARALVTVVDQASRSAR